MTKLRLTLGKLRTVIERPMFRKHARFRPGGESLETRAFQSGFKAVPALLESLRPATAVHVVPVKIASALNVISHTSQVDILSRARRRKPSVLRHRPAVPWPLLTTRLAIKMTFSHRRMVMMTMMVVTTTVMSTATIRQGPERPSPPTQFDMVRRPASQGRQSDLPGFDVLKTHLCTSRWSLGEGTSEIPHTSIL